MSCTDVRDDLSAFLDGELDPRRRAEVEAHLESCAACRALLAALREGADAVGGLPRERAPADFAGRVLASLDAAPAGGGRLLRLLAPWAGVAAAAVLVFAVLQATREQPEHAVSTARVPAAEERRALEAGEGVASNPAVRDEDKFAGLLEDAKAADEKGQANERTKDGAFRRLDEPVVRLGADPRPGGEPEPRPVEAPARLKSEAPTLEEQDQEKAKAVAAAREVAKLEAEKAAAAEGNKKEEASRQAGAGGGGRGAGLRKGEPPPPAASAPAAPAPAPTPVVQAAPDPAAREAELKSAPVYCLLLANERFAELRARAVQAFDERAWSSSAPADLLSGLESKAKKADPSSLGFSGGPSQGLGLDARVLWLSDEEFASVQKAAEELGRFRPALPEERTQVRQLLERESLSKDDAGKGPPPAAPAPGAAKAPPAQQDLSKSREAPKSPAEPSRPPVPEASPKPDAETKPSGRVAATAGGERAPAPDYRRRAEADRAPAPVRRAYVIRILPERLPSGR